MSKPGTNQPMFCGVWSLLLLVCLFLPTHGWGAPPLIAGPPSGMAV